MLDSRTVERSFDCLIASAKRVREFVGGVLDRWRVGGAVDDVLLVADELATNAVVHARSDYVVRLRLHGARVRVEVEDGSERPPQLGASSPSSDGGRGLVLVDALAAGWGWEERPGGKLVWAEISTES